MPNQFQLPGQLGFNALLHEASKQNKAREFERETAHLPSTMEDALPFYRDLLEQHHAAMLIAERDHVLALREEAHKLALRLNNGEPGIRANDDAPGCTLERLTAAIPGDVPLWGQTGEFIIEAAGTRARIVMDGIFGLGGCFLYWPGIAVHAVDTDEPFISKTGYRRFIGIGADVQADMTPDSFACAVVESYVEDELKGKLVAIDREYLSAE